MIFYRIVNYGDRFYLDIRLRNSIYDVIKPQVQSASQPVFLVYYLSRSPEKAIPALRQICLQRQPGMSDHQLIEEAVDKVITLCKNKNEIFHGK